ncbi:MAG: hypothetical protein IT163_09775 [Bryobacterales bacterium]|nr:hypothetical protein [Bryobacterales bacterium]
MLAILIVAVAILWGGWMLIRVMLMVRENRQRANEREYFMRTFGKERDAL